MLRRNKDGECFSPSTYSSLFLHIQEKGTIAGKHIIKTTLERNLVKYTHPSPRRNANKMQTAPQNQNRK